MGCKDSKLAKEQPGLTVSVQKAPPKPKREGPPLDPRDFILSKRTGESITKAAGSIMGEQFNLEECVDCDIFLLDNIAQCFVDDCENCRVFVGPTASSVFMRNCESCDMVIACQQFRSRECKDCRLSLICATEPIVETSQGMRFACFDFSYFSLRRQLELAGLKVWNNRWWMVHDFNNNLDKPNWDLLPQDEVAGLLRRDKALGGEEFDLEPVVPVTLGSRPRPSLESCTVIFLPGAETLLETFLVKVTGRKGVVLCRTRAMRLPDDRAKSLFAWSKEIIAPRCRMGDVMGVEVCGDGSRAAVEDLLANTGLAAGAKSIWVLPEKDGTLLTKTFFETWQDDI